MLSLEQQHTVVCKPLREALDRHRVAAAALREARKGHSLALLMEAQREANSAETRLIDAENEFMAYVGARMADSLHAQSRTRWPEALPTRLHGYIFRWTEARHKAGHVYQAAALPRVAL